MCRAELTSEKEKLALVQEQLKDKQAKEETERKVKEVEQEKLDVQRMEERNQLMVLPLKIWKTENRQKETALLKESLTYERRTGCGALPAIC